MPPIPYFFGSHPAWVRGLKLLNMCIAYIDLLVAPRVGAWIETKAIGRSTTEFTVAPRVGAWIETSKILTTSRSLQSHPAWVRGLKHEI